MKNAKTQKCVKSTLFYMDSLNYLLYGIRVTDYKTMSIM